MKFKRKQYFVILSNNRPFSRCAFQERSGALLPFTGRSFKTVEGKTYFYEVSPQPAEYTMTDVDRVANMFSSTSTLILEKGYKFFVKHYLFDYEVESLY